MTLFILEKKKNTLPFVGLLKGVIYIYILKKEHFLINSLIHLKLNSLMRKMLYYKLLILIYDFIYFRKQIIFYILLQNNKIFSHIV